MNSDSQEFNSYSNAESENNLNIKLSEIYSVWINRIKAYSKPNTIIKYEGIYCNHLSELTDLSVSEIDTKVISRLTDNLLNQGLSAKTVNDILLELNMILRTAEEECELTAPKIRYLHENKKQMRVLSIDEQKRLNEYLINDMDIHKFGVLLALHTGIRVGELCALKWNDVSYNSLYINKTMMRVKCAPGKTKIIVAPPKSASSIRVIPFSEELEKYFSVFRGEGYVLSSENLPYTEPRLMQYKFERYAKDCGLENISFHALRHTFATRCIEAGVDAKTVSELLGHSDTKITLQCYVHSSFELKQNSIKRMEELLIS